MNQGRLSKHCKDNGVIITAYSPLGSPDRPWAKPGDPQLLDDPKIKSIAEKYKKTPAQIVIRYYLFFLSKRIFFYNYVIIYFRYQIERNHTVIPKSVTKSRIQQNFEVFDFELSADDIKLIDSFDCNGRLVPMTG